MAAENHNPEAETSQQQPASTPENTPVAAPEVTSESTPENTPTENGTQAETENPANTPDNAAEKSADQGKGTDSVENSAGDADPSPLDSENVRLTAENDQLKAEITQARADLYNLRQEYQAYVRRTKTEFEQHQNAGQRKVLTAMLDVLDAIYAAEQADELEGPFAAIANKLQSTLENQFGLRRFGTVGEQFDPNRHDALMAQESTEVTEPEIATVLQPGYEIGAEILRATRVIVNNPA